MKGCDDRWLCNTKRTVEFKQIEDKGKIKVNRKRNLKNATESSFIQIIKERDP